MSNFAHSPPNNVDSVFQIEWEKAYQKLLVEFLKKHEEFDGSAVAKWMRSKGLHDPVHHNFWGAQIKYYSRMGWFEPLGKVVPSGAAHITEVRFWKSK